MTWLIVIGFFAFMQYAVWSEQRDAAREDAALKKKETDHEGK